MSNYSSLKATINANVKQNGNQEITGAIMNSVLNAMVDSLGAGYQYKGVATPATNPGTPDYNVFYLASEAGTYTNFGGIVIGDNEVAALVYNGSWSKQTTGAATASEVSQLAQEVTDLEQEKLDKELEDDKLYIADGNHNIIAQIDVEGVSTIDVKVKIGGELVSVKSLLTSLGTDKLDHTLEDDKLIITDSDGYTIVRIDSSGIHSAQDKHSVACMVLGEYYYPTTTPTRDGDGNVTHAEVMFGTGVEGEIDVTYTGGVSTRVDVTYGAYSYVITIDRDSFRNVNHVTIE